MRSLKNKSFLSAVTQYIARLICLTSLFWFGLILAGNVTSIANATKPDCNTSVGSRVATNAPSLMATAAGYWTFADTALSIQKCRCGDHELRQRLDSLRSIDTSGLTSKQDASQLVALAEYSGATSSRCPAGLIWSFENDEVQTRLLTSDSGTPTLLAAAVAFRDRDGWQLTVLEPRQIKQGHLLPLPPNVKTTCSRRSETGVLQLELATTSQTGDQLLDLWRYTGWEVQRTPWGNQGAFSYLCIRDNAMVYVWSESASGTRTIMMTSSKDSAAQ